MERNCEQTVLEEKEFKLPEVGHIGYLVKDVSRVAECFKAMCGIQDFHIYYYIPQRAWAYGVNVFDCKFRIALGKQERGAKIELIQVLSGVTTPQYIAFQQSGEHIHHIAYYIDDYEAWRVHYLGMGATIIFETHLEDEALGKRSCFYATLSNMPHIIEIIGRHTTTAIESEAIMEAHNGAGR